jgi:hypothetical protein
LSRCPFSKCQEFLDSQDVFFKVSRFSQHVFEMSRSRVSIKTTSRQIKTPRLIFFTNQSKVCTEEFYNGNWQSFTYLILRRSVRKGHFSALILQNFVSMCLGARRARCLSTILHLRKDITNYVLQKIFTKMIFKLC